MPKIILCLLNRVFFFGGGKFLHYDRENRIASKSVVFRYHRYIKLTHSPQIKHISTLFFAPPIKVIYSHIKPEIMTSFQIFNWERKPQTNYLTFIKSNRFSLLNCKLISLPMILRWNYIKQFLIFKVTVFLWMALFTKKLYSNRFFWMRLYESIEWEIHVSPELRFKRKLIDKNPFSMKLYSIYCTMWWTQRHWFN